MDTIEEFENLVKGKFLIDDEAVLGKYHISITEGSKHNKDDEILIITSKRFFIRSDDYKGNGHYAMLRPDGLGIAIFAMKNIKSISTLAYNSEPNIYIHYFDGNFFGDWAKNIIPFLFTKESDAQEAFQILAKNIPL